MSALPKNGHRVENQSNQCPAALDVKLFVNGALNGEGAVGSAMIRQGIEPFEIGRDSISPVSPDYKSKGTFPFTGTIENVQFDSTPQRQ